MDEVTSKIIIVKLQVLISGSYEEFWDLLRLNRDQLRWIVGLLTGHCHLK
jgi:hypothetical protein